MLPAYAWLQKGKKKTEQSSLENIWGVSGIKG